jgi:hypothetical protein
MPSGSVVSIPQYRLSPFIVARVDALRCGGVKSVLAEINPQRILCITWSYHVDRHGEVVMSDLVDWLPPVLN